MASLPPYQPDPETVRRQDKDHLFMLSIGYYLIAAVNLLAAIAGLLYIALGAGLIFVIPPGKGGPPPQLFGGLFIVIGAIFCVVTILITTLLILTGRALSRQRYHTFCLVMAGLCCSSFPLGTALGVFTFIVLLRPSVKQLFQESIYNPM